MCLKAVFSCYVLLINLYSLYKKSDTPILITGIDTAKEIRRYNKTASIIFFSSSPEFALESYSVIALNYALKPVTEEKFFLALDEVLDRIREEKEDTIIVKSQGGIQIIQISNLVFAEVKGRHVLYHLRSGRVIKCVESFTSVSGNLLKYRQFIKPHRSFIINMQYVDTIQKSQITMQTLTTVPIAQGRTREIKQRCLDYQMEAE